MQKYQKNSHIGKSTHFNYPPFLTTETMDHNEFLMNCYEHWFSILGSWRHCLLRNIGLQQACTTYSPRAKCGPRKIIIWNEKPKMMYIQRVLGSSFHKKKTFECVKMHQFWPAMRFALCTLSLECRDYLLNLAILVGKFL